MFKFIKTFLRYSDIFNIKTDFNEFIEEIKQYKLTSWLKILSSFNIALTYDEYFRIETQIGQRNYVFSKKICEKISKHQLKSGVDFLFFPEQIIKMNILVLRFCDDNAPNEFESDKDGEKFGLFLLKLNDYLEENFDEEYYESLSENKKEDYTRDLIAINYYLSSTQDLKHLITRYYLIFKEISSNEKFKTKFDIQNKFKNITELEIEEYLAICFAFLSQWFYLRGGKPKAFLINKNRLFKKTQINMDKIDNVINQLSSNIHNIREKITERYDETKNLDYAAILLRDKPLIELQNGNFICVDQRYYHEKFTEGIYWILLDNLENEERNNFFQLFGEIFEYYVCNVLKSVFHNRYFKIRYDNREASDCIVEYPEAVIFFEIKSSRPIKTTPKGDFEPKIDEVLKKAFKQLDKTIIDFREGKFDINGRKYKDFKYIFPILITLKKFPQDFLTIMYMNKLITKHGFFKEPKIKFAREKQLRNNIYVDIIDAEEIEILESLCKEKSFLAILEKKNRDLDYRYSPLKNFLFDKYNIDEKKNERLYRKYNEIGKLFRRILFHKSN